MLIAPSISRCITSQGGHQHFVRWRCSAEPAAATEQGPAARLEGTALFPRLRRLNLHQNPAETLHIRRLENGLERPCGRSRPAPRHLASLVVAANGFLRLGTNLGAAFAPNYARDYARGGGDYAEPQYGGPVLSWFNSGLNGQGRPLAGLGRSPAWRF
jgi:hypothetical protein